jgi:hypothetical protein
MVYLYWNYASVLGIETPCIIAVIGVQARGGGGAPEFGNNHFSGNLFPIFGHRQ